MTTDKNGVGRYQNWCLVSHGHDMLEKADGLFVLYSDYQSLQAKNAELREALQFYADVLSNSRSMTSRIVMQDGGKRARQALDQTGEKG